LCGHAAAEPAVQLPLPSQVLGVSIAFEQAFAQLVPEAT
jgi:hypothetical protein